VKVRIALATLAGMATLAMVGVAATATSASASTIPTTVSHITYPSGDCAGGQLTATLTRGYQTRWNNRELVLTLTNTSSRACSMSGYPGLQLLNNRYQPLSTTVVQVPGQTYWRAQTVLRPGQSATADITFAVSGLFYPARNYTPAFYPRGAAYLAVTLPGTYQASRPPYGQPNLMPYMPRFVLPIPGGPVRIVQDRLYETPLMLEFPGVW
jgi:Protein of unknown function (DUF4232)